jgi:TolA-binding protein
MTYEITTISLTPEEKDFIKSYGLSATALIKQKIMEMMLWKKEFAEKQLNAMRIRIEEMANRLQEQIDRAERAEEEVEALKKLEELKK